MKQSYKDQIERIKKISHDMIKVFEFEEGFRRIPTEHEINEWALEIDKAMMTDSKRVRSEALELTMWMSEFARRLCKEKYK